MKRLTRILLYTSAAGFSQTIAAAPSGGQVTAGSASIQQIGSTTQVLQNTAQAIFQWDTFSIGVNESVNFIQPSSSSIALNRVTGQSPSQILGNLTANGQVFLINPRGVFFSKSATVDVGGLVASTLNITDQDFLARRFSFDNASDMHGVVANAGQITAQDGGYIVLIGDEVNNSGLLVATLGDVALGAAGRISLDLQGDRMIQFAVDAASVSAFANVKNEGQIIANGGQVLLTAQVSNALLSTVVQNDGLIAAQGIQEKNGEIYLIGNGGDTINTGVLDVSSADSQGGIIHILGDRVGLTNASVVLANGTDGGSIKIGGDFQGGGSLQRSQHTSILSGATIQANGTLGAGGEVIVWSDVTTQFAGTIEATGQQGDGGFVEVSGKQNLSFIGDVNTASVFGATGTLLLDPLDIIIVNGAADPGNDAELGDGQILFADGPGVTFFISEGSLEGLSANVILQADRDIILNDLADNNLDLTAAGGSVLFQAGRNITLLDTNDQINTFATLTLAADSPLSNLGAADGIGTLTIGNVTGNGVFLSGADIIFEGDMTNASFNDINLTASNDIVFTNNIAPQFSVITATAGNNITLQNATLTPANLIFTVAQDIIVNGSIDLTPTTSSSAILFTTTRDFILNGDLLGNQTALAIELNVGRDLVINGRTELLPDATGFGGSGGPATGNVIAGGSNNVLFNAGRNVSLGDVEIFGGFESQLTINAGVDISANGKLNAIQNVLTAGGDIIFNSTVFNNDLFLTAGNDIRFNGNVISTFTVIEAVAGRNIEIQGNSIFNPAVFDFTAGQDVIHNGNIDLTPTTAGSSLLITARDFILNGNLNGNQTQLEIGLNIDRDLIINGTTQLLPDGTGFVGVGNVLAFGSNDITFTAGRNIALNGLVIFGNSNPLVDINVGGNFFSNGPLVSPTGPFDLFVTAGNATFNGVTNTNGGFIDVLTFNDLLVNGTFSSSDAFLGSFGDTIISGAITANNLTIDADGDVIIENGTTINVSNNALLEADAEVNGVGNLIVQTNASISARDLILLGSNIALNGSVASDTFLDIFSDGAVVNNAQITSGGPLTILGLDNITINGAINASTSVNIDSLFGDVVLNGQLQVGGLTLLTAGRNLIFNNNVFTNGDLDAAAENDIRVQNGAIFAKRASFLADLDGNNVGNFFGAPGTTITADSIRVDAINIDPRGQFSSGLVTLIGNVIGLAEDEAERVIGNLFNEKQDRLIAGPLEETPDNVVDGLEDDEKVLEEQSLITLADADTNSLACTP